MLLFKLNVIKSVVFITVLGAANNIPGEFFSIYEQQKIDKSNGIDRNQVLKDFIISTREKINYNVELLKGGGFYIELNGIKIPIESRFSKLNGRWNSLSCGSKEGWIKLTD